jgi:hypothetical protein
MRPTASLEEFDPMSETLNPSSYPSDQPLTPVDSASPGLSEVSRFVDTLVTPSKTFADIHRSSRWWLPFLFGALVTYVFFYAVQRQVGWTQITENQIKQNAKMQEQFATLEPAQANERKQQIAAFTKYVFYAAPVMSLILAVICAAVMLATVNFGFGGEATFGKMLAVWMYAWIPLSIQGLLAAGVLFAGVTPEQFNLQNPVGTNIGYYLPADTSKGLMTLATSFDIMTIWTLVLLVIGCSIVGKISRGKAGVAVFGWWILIVLAKTAMAIVQS